MNTRPKFLDAPRSYTMASRTSTSRPDYACSVERSRRTDYPASWWVAMAICAVLTLVAVWGAR